MNIALPILLLVFGGLSFWILTESKVKWYVKTSYEKKAYFLLSQKSNDHSLQRDTR